MTTRFPAENDLLEFGLTGTGYTLTLHTRATTVYVRLYSQANGTRPYNSSTYLDL